MRDNSIQMQNRPFLHRNVISTAKSSDQKSSAKTAIPKDHLSRVFNTALVSSLAGEKKDFSSELYELTERPSFKAILSAVRQLAGLQGIDERQAAEEVIQTFRKVDEIWENYVFKEGLDRIREPRK